MGNAAPTQLCKLAIGASDPVDFALNYSDFDPGVTEELFDGNRTKGTYDKDGNLVVLNSIRVNPRYSGIPTVAELNKLLEWGMGGAVTGTTTKTYPLGDVLPQRYVFYAPNHGEQWFLSGCVVDSMTISASQGDGLTVNLDLVGMTSDATRVNFPVLALDQATKPFVMSNLVLSVGGVTRNCRSFNFGVAHNVDKNRMLNSLTLTDTVKDDQSVTLAVELPSGENPATWNIGLAACAVLATFTNADGKAFTLSFADVRFPPRSPVFASKSEGYLTLQGECYRVGAGRPVTVTLVQ